MVGPDGAHCARQPYDPSRYARRWIVTGHWQVWPQRLSRSTAALLFSTNPSARPSSHLDAQILICQSFLWGCISFGWAAVSQQKFNQICRQPSIRENTRCSHIPLRCHDVQSYTPLMDVSIYRIFGLSSYEIWCKESFLPPDILSSKIQINSHWPIARLDFALTLAFVFICKQNHHGKFVARIANF